MDGINAGRKTIPFARFDAKRCAQGLEALRSYRVEWDEKARAFKKTPEHNASHGADAWRYLSLSWRIPMREPEPAKAPFGMSMSNLTMDQFMDIEDGWSRQEERVWPSRPVNTKRASARRLPRCHFCSIPSIPMMRKLAYLLPTSASS